VVWYVDSSKTRARDVLYNADMEINTILMLQQQHKQTGTFTLQVKNMSIVFDQGQPPLLFPMPPWLN
jgi:hypothetical protein